MKFSHILSLGAIVTSFSYISINQGCCNSTTDSDGDGVVCSEDCDDDNPENYPGNEEVCDGNDNNCDYNVPDDETTDIDGDTYVQCNDCNDLNPLINPSAPEICDGQDSNCDGFTPADENDSDGDSYRVCDGDCDDRNSAVYPGAEEACDGLDNDCDGSIPLEESDNDNDGFRVCAGDCDDNEETAYPGGTEACDGIDNNCDGLADVVVAQSGTWYRSSCSPVLSAQSGTYTANGIDQSFVLYNSDLNIFQMWFRAFDSSNVTSIGYATSVNGSNWVRNGSPVLTAAGGSGWDGSKVGFPAVLYRNGTYQMWYQGQDTSQRIRIGYATSSDGLIWTRYGTGAVVPLGATGTWDSTSVQAPSVMYDESSALYRMWYSGGDSTYFQTGYAESVDGITWTKYTSNPVIRVGGSGSWDSRRTIFAHVNRTLGGFELWYSGDDTSNTYTYEIGYASAPNATSWTKYATNPVFSFSTTGQWDSYMVYASQIIELDDGFSMYYSGATQSSGPYAIGLARSFQPAPSLVSPEPGEFIRQAERVELDLQVNDLQSFDQLKVLWFSDLDGLLGQSDVDAYGQSSFSTTALTIGEHQLTGMVMNNEMLLSKAESWIEVR